MSELDEPTEPGLVSTSDPGSEIDAPSCPPRQTNQTAPAPNAMLACGRCTASSPSAEIGVVVEFWSGLMS